VTLQALDAVIKAASVSADEPAKIPRTRDNSKQVQVIALLRRPEGATIAEICEATGWQPHTVRGTFAGTFKKKLRLTISSTKELDKDRIYKVGI
jgi:predicted transcriptional regulator